MHLATRARLFFLGLLPLLMGCLASSCQSSRTSFLFQPAPYRAAPALTPSAGPSAAATAAVPTAPAAVGAAPTPHLNRRLVRLAAVLPTPAVAAADPTVATGAAPAPTQRHLPRLLRQRATHGTAENGLAGVALFFIGVALAAVAGLGALVALLPGVSFWGGVGLAVAALLVLFLLYGLVSGGKKKA